jgi:hypothetical protein
MGGRRKTEDGKELELERDSGEKRGSYAGGYITGEHETAHEGRP